MSKFAVAALALVCATASLAQAPAAPDLSAATPLPGRWIWGPASDGSEASFLDSAGRAQLWLHCVRASRLVTIARPGLGAAPFVTVWASNAARSIPASYNPATARITVQLSANDGLLDALAFSRGRIGVGVTGTPLLVAPAWPEIGRVIEDCRA